MAKVSKEELKKRILEKKKEIRDAITGISKYITKKSKRIKAQLVPSKKLRRRLKHAKIIGATAALSLGNISPTAAVTPVPKDGIKVNKNIIADAVKPGVKLKEAKYLEYAKNMDLDSEIASFVKDYTKGDLSSFDSLSEDMKKEMKDIFSPLVDFSVIEGKKGQFNCAYDKNGDIVYASVVSKGKKASVYLFTNDKGEKDYYTEDGLRVHDIMMPKPTEGVFTSPFGPRRPPVKGASSFHQGGDFANATGTRIDAAADGVVSYVGFIKGYGKTIIVDHSGGYQSLYGHLNNYGKGIKVGQEVQKGKKIGEMGSTGRSGGAHLHFEVRLNGKAVNFLNAGFIGQKPTAKSTIGRVRMDDKVIFLGENLNEKENERFQEMVGETKIDNKEMFAQETMQVLSSSPEKLRAKLAEDLKSLSDSEKVEYLYSYGREDKAPFNDYIEKNKSQDIAFHNQNAKTYDATNNFIKLYSSKKSRA